MNSAAHDREELLKLEKEFERAVVSNDAAAAGRLLADDWTIVGPDGRIIDRSRFLEVIKSGALSHEKMESDDVRVRIYDNAASVTAQTFCAAGRWAASRTDSDTE